MRIDGRRLAPGEEIEIDSVRPPSHRAHLYASAASLDAAAESLDPGAELIGRVRLLPPAGNLGTPAFLASLTLTGILILAAGRHLDLNVADASTTSQVTAAVVLLLPTLLQGSILRYPEHAVAQSGLSPVRLLVWISALTGLVGVAALGGLVGDKPSLSLWITAAASGVVTAGFVGVWVARLLERAVEP